MREGLNPIRYEERLKGWDLFSLARRKRRGIVIAVSKQMEKKGNDQPWHSRGTWQEASVSCWPRGEHEQDGGKGVFNVKT